jgi:hypothetical protein
MIAVCWHLGGLPELEGLRLRPWAHMLGFRGHFSTKSRRYSTTLRCLRGARQQWRSFQLLAAHGIDAATPVRRCAARAINELDIEDGEDDRVLIVGQWRYTGRGHTPGEAIYASTIAADLAETRCILRSMRGTGDE